MTRFGYLPEYVMEEIMSWLPADSLIRFKCVSKSWYALITDPDFVSKHLENTKKRSSYSLVLSVTHQEVDQSTGKSLKSYDLWSLNLSGDRNENGDHVCSSTDLLKFPFGLYGYGSGLAFTDEVYHCDGIIVRVVDGGEYVILANPVLRKFRTLPGPTFYYSSFGFGMNGSAFGYDSVAETYKFIRLFCHHALPETRAKVLTLGTCLWREVEFPRGVNLRSSEGLYSGGFCYWLAEDLEHKEKFLCFDMSCEEFHVLPMPKSSSSPKTLEWHQLSGWNDGFVCFQMTNNNDKDLRVEVFVMDDSSNVVNGCCSWTQRLIIEIEDEQEIEDVVKFWKSDELLMMDYSQNLVSYNLSTKKYRRFSVDGVGLIKARTSFYWPLLYMKTLASDFMYEENSDDLYFLYGD